MVGEGLLGRGTVVWSPSTMFDCIAEGVALASAAAQVAFAACMAAGCSCKLDMTLANLVLGSKWWVERKFVAMVAKCS